MTVAELIEQLKALPPHDEIVIDLGGMGVPTEPFVSRYCFDKRYGCIQGLHKAGTEYTKREFWVIG
jgi:hypothetical protein